MVNKKVPILIAGDHFGMILKNPIRDYLIEKGYEVKDLGVNTDAPVLYPEIAINFCDELKAGSYTRGILVCGTGIGMAIVANKVPGVRAAVIHDPYSAERSRASNDAQVATLGSLVIGVNAAKKMVDIWLESEFGGGRSQQKVDMIKAMDEKRYNK
ncbi:MAG: ribose 5-phosphate isomerase B [Pelolinea sp.]|nr:ribose 5-phosphate isomerase B [Pelolinea sp.]